MIQWFTNEYLFLPTTEKTKIFLFLLISFVESSIFVNGFSNKEFKHGSFFFCWNQVNKVYKVQGVHLMYLVCVCISYMYNRRKFPCIMHICSNCMQSVLHISRIFSTITLCILSKKNYSKFNNIRIRFG